MIYGISQAGFNPNKALILSSMIELISNQSYLWRGIEMEALTRITFDSRVMGGKPCIHGMRVTVGMIVGLIASGHAKKDILKLYPYLEPEDIDQALTYAAWRVEEIDVPLVSVSQ